MIYFVMFLKSAAWAFSFWIGIRRGVKGMLLWAAGISVFLTLADGVTGSAGTHYFPILLSMFLYTLMSFLLLPIAWKMRNPAVSMACNLAGTLGAFAMVHFTMEFITGTLTI